MFEKAVVAAAEREFALRRRRNDGLVEVQQSLHVLGGCDVYLVRHDDDGFRALADAAGLGRSEELREFLAPNSRPGWIVLLGGVLPIVAGFEELLFRGVLVGAFATGFGVSPWVLVLASSVLFGLGHGAQGRLGVLVTGSLGFVLGAAFVLTDSLLVVVVAHYLVNALEFVVHER